MRGSSVVALVLVAAASAASGPFACVHASDAFGRGLKFFESFEGKGLNAWIQSSDTMYNGELKMKDGGFVGMDGFGASAPAGDLYKHFGITAEAVVAQVKQRI